MIRKILLDSKTESFSFVRIVRCRKVPHLHSCFRACLKKAFRRLRVPVCGRFYLSEGGVAGYGNRMKVKYTAKWDAQIAEMIFQTRSRQADADGDFLFRLFFRF